MQLIDSHIIRKAKREKVQKLESELKLLLSSCRNGERILCPLCKYSSAKNKFSAVVFENNTFKCFSCGAWRRIE